MSTNFSVRRVVCVFYIFKRSIDRVKVLALLNCEVFEEIAKKELDELGKLNNKLPFCYNRYNNCSAHLWTDSRPSDARARPP